MPLHWFTLRFFSQPIKTQELEFLCNTSPILDVRRITNAVLVYSVYKKELVRTSVFLLSIEFTSFLSNLCSTTLFIATKTASLLSDWWWRWDLSYDQNIEQVHCSSAIPPSTDTLTSRTRSDSGTHTPSGPKQTRIRVDSKARDLYMRPIERKSTKLHTRNILMGAGVTALNWSTPHYGPGPLQGHGKLYIVRANRVSLSCGYKASAQEQVIQLCLWPRNRELSPG